MERPEHDICHSNAQCLNGGFCQGGDTFGTFTVCKCPIGYGGERCEDHCPLDCLNGGQCIANGTPADKTPTYHCKCFGLYTGTLCSLSYVNCSDGSRCYNGGMCISRDDGGVETGHTVVRSSSEMGGTGTTTTTTSGAKAVVVTCACPDEYMGPTCRMARSSNNNATSSPHFWEFLVQNSSWRLLLSVIVAILGLVMGVVVYSALVRFRRRRGSNKGIISNTRSRVEPQYSSLELQEGDKHQPGDIGASEWKHRNIV